MSLVNVILASNRLQIANEGDDILLDSVTYTNIVSVNPLVSTKKDEVGFVPGMDSANPYELPTTENIYWRVELHLADGRKEYIFLEDVDNQAGWTNDAAGYAAAEEDIYAAFPTGGGGSGTVTSVGASGGTTGFGFSGSPVTGSGTLTLTVSNAATAQQAIGLPKTYRVTIVQTGTADPVATVKESTITGTPVWTRIGVGEYEATLSGAFPVGKSFSNYNEPTAIIDQGDQIGYLHYTADGNTMILRFFDSSFTPIELSATNIWLTVDIYP